MVATGQVCRHRHFLAHPENLRILQQIPLSNHQLGQKVLCPICFPKFLLFAVFGMPSPPDIVSIKSGSRISWKSTLLTSRWCSSASGTSPAILFWLSWQGSCFWSSLGSSWFLEDCGLRSLLARLPRGTSSLGSSWSFQGLGSFLPAILLVAFLF